MLNLLAASGTRNLCNNINSLIIFTGSFPVYSSRSIGSLLGGEILIITGPTFKPDDNIVCSFGGVETTGGFITKDSCLCVTPPADNDGIVQLNIKITRGTATLNGGTKFRYG